MIYGNLTVPGFGEAGISITPEEHRNANGALFLRLTLKNNQTSQIFVIDIAKTSVELLQDQIEQIMRFDKQGNLR